MPVTVIVGGQKGDEGKGKISAYLALKENFDIIIRISGPNAGHTIKFKDKTLGLATIPCGFINEKSRLLIGRGAFVDVARFLDEAQKTGLSGKGRLAVDRHATIITDDLKNQERQNDHLMKAIGSVGTGLGPARINKLNRNSDVVFVSFVLARNF